MSRRIISGIMLILLIVSMLKLGSIHAVKAAEEQSSVEYLRLSTMEDMTVLENGTVQQEILMNVTSPRLAEIYRELLAAPPDADVEEEMPIPQYRTVQSGSGENATEVLIPVREEFYKSLVKEQRLSAGLVTNVSECKMVARGMGNECRVSIFAQATFEIVNVTRIGSEMLWQIPIGPVDAASFTEFFLTKVIFARQMLESLPGEQIYENSKRTRIRLPMNATLLNSEELTQLSWKIDFGGSTYLESSVSLEETSILVVDEKIVITEHDITADPEYIQEAFSSYKSCKIEYLLSCSGFEYPEAKKSNVVSTWCHDESYAFSESISIPFRCDDLSLALTVRPSLNFSWHVGWDFHWFRLKSFEARMDIEASVKVKFEASAKVNVSKTWDTTIFEWNVRISFWVGWVPVWVDVRVTIDTVLDVKAYGEVSFVVETEASGGFEAGVTWAEGEWSKSISQTLSMDEPNVTLYAQAEIRVNPSIEFQLAFLFYSVAGPFVEFEPYVNAMAEIAALPEITGKWEVSLGFNISAGVTFSGWLKQLLGIPDWECPLYNHVFGSWNGSQTGPGNWTEPEIHDLAIVSIRPSGAPIYRGDTVDVNVTVRNNGEFNETANVTLYFRRRPAKIDTTTDICLASGEHATVTFSWDTFRLRPGNYTLEAEVSTVANESNFENNVMNLTVYIIGINDIAVLDVSAHPNETYAGRAVNITVTLRNLEDIIEKINVTVYCNNTVIGTQTFIEIAPGEETTLSFLWGTTNLTPYQNYTIWANVTTLHYDINVTNNIFSSATLKIKMLGDINGDGKVDLYDIVLMAKIYGCKEADLLWNPNADLAPAYGIIDIYDIITCLSHYGEEYP